MRCDDMISIVHISLPALRTKLLSNAVCQERATGILSSLLTLKKSKTEYYTQIYRKMTQFIAVNSTIYDHQLLQVSMMPNGTQLPGRLSYLTKASTVFKDLSC